MVAYIITQNTWRMFWSLMEMKMISGYFTSSVSDGNENDLRIFYRLSLLPAACFWAENMYLLWKGLARVQ
jgi:hypothetical protein